MHTAKELYQVSELGLSHYCSASLKRCQVNLMKKSCSYKSSGHIYANICHLGACTRERRIESNLGKRPREMLISSEHALLLQGSWV